MNYRRLELTERVREGAEPPPTWTYSCPHCGRTKMITRDDLAGSSSPTYTGGFFANWPSHWEEMPEHIEQYFPGVMEMIKGDTADRYIHFNCGCGAPVIISFFEREVRMSHYVYDLRAVYETNTWPISQGTVEELPPASESSAGGYRVFNFKSVELVRIGEGRARITRVTDARVEYTDESGRELFVDLDECARIGGCLEAKGLFPPGEDLDWSAAADDLCGRASDTHGGCVGLRGAMDEPPWFQFLNRRRTQFEFKDYEAIHAQLLGTMGRMTFDAS